MFQGEALERETNEIVLRGRVNMPKRPIQCYYCGFVCCRRTLVRSHLVFGAKKVCQKFPTTGLPNDLGTDLQKAKDYAKSLVFLCKYVDDGENQVQEQSCSEEFPTDLTKETYLTQNMLLNGYERFSMSFIKPVKANVSEEAKKTQTVKRKVQFSKYQCRNPKSRVAEVRRILSHIFPPNSVFTVADLRARMVKFLESSEELSEFRVNQRKNEKEISSAHLGSIWTAGAHLLRFLSVHCDDGSYVNVLETLEKQFKQRASMMHGKAKIEREENHHSPKSEQLLDLGQVENLFEKPEIRNLITYCKQIVETDSIPNEKNAFALKYLVTFVLLLKTGKRSQVILSIMHEDVFEAEPIVENGIKLLEMIIKPGPHLTSFKKCIHIMSSELCVTEQVYDLMLLLAKIERKRIRYLEKEYNPESRYLIGRQLSSTAYEVTGDLVDSFFRWLHIAKLERTQNYCIRRTLITQCRRFFDITKNEEISLSDYFDHSLKMQKDIYEIKTVKIFDPIKSKVKVKPAKFRDLIESKVKIHPAIIIDYICKINLPGGEREFETLDDLRSHFESQIQTSEDV